MEVAAHDRHSHATRTLRRAAIRTAARRASSWTGRSALSAATDTVLSRLATAGARKTRVSEMRDAAARPAGRSLLGTPDATGAATAPQRRRSSGPPLTAHVSSA